MDWLPLLSPQNLYLEMTQRRRPNRLIANSQQVRVGARYTLLSASNISDDPSETGRLGSSATPWCHGVYHPSHPHGAPGTLARRAVLKHQIFPDGHILEVFVLICVHKWTDMTIGPELAVAHCRSCLEQDRTGGDDGGILHGNTPSWNSW